jgi:hypothetical protein
MPAGTLPIQPQLAVNDLAAWQLPGRLGPQIHDGRLPSMSKQFVRTGTRSDCPCGGGEPACPVSLLFEVAVSDLPRAAEKNCSCKCIARCEQGSFNTPEFPQSHDQAIESCSGPSPATARPSILRCSNTSPHSGGRISISPATTNGRASSPHKVGSDRSAPQIALAYSVVRFSDGPPT